MRPYPEDGGEYEYRKPNPGSDDPDFNPEIEVTKPGLTVSGYLQTAMYAWYYQNPDGDDFADLEPDLIDDIEIPAAEVQFINAVTVELPSTGGGGTDTTWNAYWMAVIGVLACTVTVLLLEFVRRTRSEKGQ